MIIANINTIFVLDTAAMVKLECQQLHPSPNADYVYISMVGNCTIHPRLIDSGAVEIDGLLNEDR